MLIEYAGNHYFIATAKDITSLSVGDLAPAWLGGNERGLARVISIKRRGVDERGNPFVEYSTRLDTNGRMSVGKMARSMRLSRLYTSSELEHIEATLQEKFLQEKI